MAYVVQHNVDYDFSAPRSFHMCACVERYLYVFGGCNDKQSLSMSSILRYDIEQDTLSLHSVSGAQQPQSTTYGCAVAIGRVIYMHGGQKPWWYPFSVSDKLWKLTGHGEDSLSWHLIRYPRGEKPTRRASHSAWVFKDCMYIFGGRQFIPYGEYVRQQAIKHLYRYVPEHNTWQRLRPKGSKPSARFNHSTTRIYNDVYLFGGEKYVYRKGEDEPDSVLLQDFHSLDLGHLQWTRILPVKNGVYPNGFTIPATIIALNPREIVLLAGADQRTHVWSYDIAARTWSQRAPDFEYEYCLKGTTLATFDNHLITFGGWDITGEDRLCVRRMAVSTLSALACKVMLQNPQLRQYYQQLPDKERSHLLAKP